MNRRTFIKSGIGVVATGAFLPEALAGALNAHPPATDLRHTLPKSDSQYQATMGYVEENPIPAYRWASDRAVAAFRKIKYSVRIHWGIYSLIGKPGESWPFLDDDYSTKDSYNHLYQTWNPVSFDAGKWTDLFVESGLQMLAFTTKHHEGFSMFDTKTRISQRVNWGLDGGPALESCNLSYSITETPFERDVVKELCDAAHMRKLKIDLYFSHPDWYDVDFRPYVYHPVRTTSDPDSGHKYTFLDGDRFPEETARMVLRHREQLSELLTNYGSIDAICLDMWLGPDVWPQLRDTLLHIRTLQPDVMLRARGIGNYGDYYTPERFVPSGKEDTLMPWIVIYPLGSSFSYDPIGQNYKGAGWIIRNLVDSIAKGGAFQVGIGPDAMGEFHREAAAQLQEAGQWLLTNGEGVYNSEPRDGLFWQDGDNMRYTRSEDSRYIYAFALEWPGGQLSLPTVEARPGSSVRLLGVKDALTWRNDPELGLIVDIPVGLQDETNRPVKHVYCFKVDGTTKASP